MTYESVDRLQRALADSVFRYAKDKKKAAGRALGTVVEIIAFYTLRAWGLRDSIAIERPLAEFANPQIKHNVEYSLHPVLASERVTLAPPNVPFSATRLRALVASDSVRRNREEDRNGCLLTGNNVLRNSCTISESAIGPVIAHLDEVSQAKAAVTISTLHRDPFAIVECKRVGVEEGVKKGPQTIEKAKQGAYVARAVSSLQKVRLRDGSIAGVIHLADGSLYHKPYKVLLDEVLASRDPTMLEGFVLTVGVVSNHGNWFTTENPNKELRVLAQSYDWLLFLTDQGLSEFIDELILRPTSVLEAAKEAFNASYTGKKGTNRFTKVRMDYEADQALQEYFKTERGKIRRWFNIISPKGGSLEELRSELTRLTQKDWTRIKGL